MLINGKTVHSSETHVSYNPATGEALGEYSSASKQNVDAALDAATVGAKAWAAMSFNQRAEIMHRAAAILAEHSEELAKLICREQGKQLFMARGEASEASALLRRSVAAAENKFGSVYPNNNAVGGLGDVAFTVREPLGVILCIAPFNFPLGTLSFKVAPSLAMGNAVIIKAASDTPLTALRYAELLNSAGFPAGTIQCLTGRGAELSDWLVDNDKINAISFTGSTGVGIKLVEKSAKHLHRLILELGGNDAFIICKDANIDDAVKETASKTLNTGQICCSQKHFLVHKSIRAEFVAKLSNTLSNVKLGDPMLPDTNMGPCISAKAAEEVERQIKHTVSQGAKLVSGGVRDGAFITPAVLDNVTAEMDVAKDMEIFGPVFPVIEYDTEEEAIAIANQSSYGLNAGVLSGNLTHAIGIAKQLEAGTVVANGVGFWRRDTAPFGGYKKSGLGREGIDNILDEVSQVKTIVIKNV